MGFVSHAIRSIFGGGGGSYSTGAATGATPAPAVADAAQQWMESNEVLKKKRGKSSLLVNTADTSATSSGGTGLNI